MKIYLYQLSSYRALNQSKYVVSDMFMSHIGEIFIYTKDGKLDNIRALGEDYQFLNEPFTKKIWSELVTCLKK